MEDSKFIWNHGTTKRLIEYFECNSFLHDSTDKDYKNPTLRKELLLNLATEIGCTVKDINGKWNHLKTYFSREHKKVKDSKTSGTGTDCIYSPKWEFFKDLDFLKTSIKTRPSQSSMHPLQGGTCSKDFQEQSPPQVNSKSVCYDNMSDDGNENVEQLVEEVQLDTTADTSKTNKKNLKRKRNTQTVSDEALEEAVKWLKAPTCTAKDDEEFHFGMMVASKMRAIQPYIRDQLKLKILELLVANSHSGVEIVNCE